MQEFYPYISDMSYLRLDPGMDLTALQANMPLWSDEFPPASGSYSLPLDEIAQLGMPMINLGPYGWGAHQRGERLLQSYSFGVLPQLIMEVIEQLGARDTAPRRELVGEQLGRVSARRAGRGPITGNERSGWRLIVALGREISLSWFGTLTNRPGLGYYSFHTEGEEAYTDDGVGGA